jgi:hypothetical protein
MCGQDVCGRTDSRVFQNKKTRGKEKNREKIGTNNNRNFN